MAKMTPENLTDGLKEICGENLCSVVLYGSAAAGDSVKTSDYNVLVVMKRVAAEDLPALTGLCSGWSRDGNHAPLLFARDTLLRSADVFPVEFSDIKQSHRILYGEDPFTGMEIEPALLRLGLERELKSKLILLRENFLAAKGSPAKVERLTVSSVSAFLTLFKAALRLYGEEPPAKKIEVIPRLSRHIKFDEEIFAIVWKFKESGKRPSLDSALLFSRYLTAVQDVTEAVDQWLQRAGDKLRETKNS